MGEDFLRPEVSAASPRTGREDGSGGPQGVDAFHLGSHSHGQAHNRPVVEASLPGPGCSDPVDSPEKR